MPALGAKERAALPNSAFAYVDATGRRILPIHDEAHVRNALARFSRVSFEDEASRDRARMRLLKAAKKLGIMPLGFVGSQLRPEQKLPRGQVTFALTDIEGSTDLVHRLGDGYGPMLSQLRRLLRAAIQLAGGREVDARGDELFAVFQRPSSTPGGRPSPRPAISAWPSIRSRVSAPRLTAARSWSHRPRAMRLTDRCRTASCSGASGPGASTACESPWSFSRLASTISWACSLRPGLSP